SILVKSMITFVLSFLSTFSSAAEKNSALSPSLIRPSTYRIVKLSVCFFSTIKACPPRFPGWSVANQGPSTGRKQFLHDIHHVPERLDGARLVIGNGDVELLLDGEQDGQRVERVDARLGQRRIRRQLLVGHLLFVSDDLHQLLRD